MHYRESPHAVILSTGILQRMIPGPKDLLLF